MDLLKTSSRPCPDLPSEKGLLEVLLRRARTGDPQARNDLIRRYLPLVLKTGWQVTGRYLQVGRDEEVSVGMLAVNEAISTYRPDRGASLLCFAKSVICKRLIDHHRRRNRPMEITLSAMASAAEAYELCVIEERQAIESGRVAEESRERREELLRYSQRLREFGINFPELEKDRPRHKDALARVMTCARVVATHPALCEHLLLRKELPLKPLEQEVSVSRRTLERQKRYIIAASLILIGNYEYLKGYIANGSGHLAGTSR